MVINFLILCGGLGKRLYPLSDRVPKQFLKIIGDKTLLDQTLERVKYICDRTAYDTNIKLLSNIKYKEYLDSYEYEKIYEPINRDTGPAIIMSILSANKNDINVILPSDHWIPNNNKFYIFISNIITKFSKKYIHLIGVKPKYPETGYGYIRLKDNEFDTFIEKPSLSNAKRFLESDDYLWNSGIVILSKTSLLNKGLSLVDMCKRCHNNKIDYVDIPKISFDYGILEKIKNIKVYRYDGQWSDVGSWKSVHYIRNKINNTDDKNLVIADKKIIIVDVDDVAVIETPDTILITSLNSSQKLKTLIN